jgi:protein-disulfide isomerase
LLLAAFLSQIAGIDTNSIAAVERQVIDITGHPVKGPANAAVTVIVFSDYLCPACNGLEPVPHQLLEQYPNDVKLVHKLCPHHDFPGKRLQPPCCMGSGQVLGVSRSALL